MLCVLLWSCCSSAPLTSLQIQLCVIVFMYLCLCCCCCWLVFVWNIFYVHICPARGDRTEKTITNLRMASDGLEICWVLRQENWHTILQCIIHRRNWLKNSCNIADRNNPSSRRLTNSHANPMQLVDLSRFREQSHRSFNNSDCVSKKLLTIFKGLFSANNYSEFRLHAPSINNWQRQKFVAKFERKI